MSVRCKCCMLSGRCLCEGLITRPEESYRLWWVVCDLETSWMRRPWPHLGVLCQKKKIIIIIIKSNRLGWALHFVRTDGNELPKKILWTNPASQRGRGRPKSIWIDGVEEDAMKMDRRNWLSAGQDGSRWRHLFEDAKTHSWLYSRWWWWRWWWNVLWNYTEPQWLNLLDTR